VSRIAVTGHIRLTRGTAALVSAALTAALRLRAAGRRGAVHGVTCLARGADQIFAHAVLAVEGTFEVVLPALDYPDRIGTGRHRAEFDDLLDRASGVEVLRYERSCRQAYRAASEAMLARCDVLFAVWDGLPSRRVGDTADVVAAARSRRVPVEVFWPAGARRLSRGECAPARRCRR